MLEVVEELVGQVILEELEELVVVELEVEMDHLLKELQDQLTLAVVVVEVTI
jgi:hypothetical protein